MSPLGCFCARCQGDPAPPAAAAAPGLTRNDSTPELAALWAHIDRLAADATADWRARAERAEAALREAQAALKWAMRWVAEPVARTKTNGDYCDAYETARRALSGPGGGTANGD